MKTKLLAIIAITVILSACAPQMIYTSCSANFQQITSNAQFKAIFSDIASELCIDSCRQGVSPKCNDYTLLVTDFVDIHSYTPGKAGILLGELMRGSINTVCGHKIMQAEFSRHFKLSDKGLVALTRNPDEIKSTEFPYSESIVGTYTYSDNKLFFFVRRINVYTGKISKFATREISYYCDNTGGSIVVR